MTFWQSTEGALTGNPEDAFTQTFTLIPDNTQAIAKIKKFDIGQGYKGEDYYFIEWLIKTGEFANKTVTQKIKVFDESPKTKHRALNMLMLIYKLKGLSPSHSGPPTAQELQPFIGMVAGIKIQETPPNNYGRQYNWVSEVHSDKDFETKTGKPLEVEFQNTLSATPAQSSFESYNAVAPSVGSAQLDDDIPF